MNDASVITFEQIAKQFDITINPADEQFFRTLMTNDMKYREANDVEMAEYKAQVHERMKDPRSVRTKDENLAAFEKGWQENLDALRTQGPSAEVLKPRYFRQNKFLRFNNGLIISENLNLEYDLFVVCRSLIFKQFLGSYHTIYELGCGSGQNLFALSQMYPEKEIVGLDWASTSVEIAMHLAKTLNRKISGLQFDMFHPAGSLKFKPHSAVFSIHALEQLGGDFTDLLEFLLKEPVDLVVNYEPILDFYDGRNALDKLALNYSRKRGYLNGYWEALQRLRQQNKIEILKACRPLIGGVIHESSLLAWRPVKYSIES